MSDVYQRLARRLDGLPHGFPSTPNGVELAILRRIFLPEEASLALRLSPLPEDVRTIARRLRRPAREVEDALDAMAARGEIAAVKHAGERLYGLLPFVIGIYEFQLQRLDAELAGLFEQYLPALSRTLGGARPALARVVPVNVRLAARPQVLPHDDLGALLSEAKSFRVAECICRKERALLGQPCSHPLETCLAFSREEDAYDRFPPGGRVISRDEAIGVLELAEDEGLVHCTYNLRRDPMFVCNCCACCCGFLRGVREFGAPFLLARSAVVSTIDAAACSGCAECASGRCPMDAIVAEDGGYRVMEERCIGCGACAAACPTDAIRLQPRPPGAAPEPPRNIVTWALARTTARWGFLRGLYARGWLAWEAARPLTRRAARPA